MSKVLRRFNVEISNPPGYFPLDEIDDAEGEYVSAQEAYDRIAVLEAEVTTLKTQLKDARKDAESFKVVGSYFDGRNLYEKSNARTV